MEIATMKFEYLPQKLNLQHPFRYINGVQIYKGINDLPYHLNKILQESVGFQELIEKGAVVYFKKEEVITDDKKEVVTPIAPTFIDTSKPELLIKNEPVVNGKISNLSQSEAIAIVNQASSINVLNQYKVEETGTKQRKAIYDAIDNKLKELETKK